MEYSKLILYGLIILHNANILLGSKLADSASYLTVSGIQKGML